MQRIFALIVLWAAVFLVAGCASQKVAVRPPAGLASPPVAVSVPPEEAPAGPGREAPAAGRPEASPEPVAQPPAAEPTGLLPPGDSEFRAERASLYRQTLRAWQELDQRFRELDLEEDRPSGWYPCLLDLEQLVAAYRAPEASSGESLSAGKGYQLDIRYLEGRCDQVFQAGKAALQGWDQQLVRLAADQLEAAVAEYAERSEPQQVIKVYRLLRRAYPDHPVTPSTVRHYCLALFRAKQLTAAIATLEETVKRASPVDPGLERLLADLLFISGQTERAGKVYQRLAARFASLDQERQWVAAQVQLLKGVDGQPREERQLFTEVLRGYLLFDGRRLPPELRKAATELDKRFPGSPLAERARRLVWQAEQQVGAWVGKRLLAVDSLVEGKRFDEAIVVLEELLKEDLSDEVRRVVQQTMDNAVLAQNEEKEARRRQLVQARAQQWQEASRLLGLRQYDAAIAAYQRLLGSDYDAKAKVKIQQAAEQAAIDLRRQAAALFVRARKAASPAQKKELALASWRLLRQILSKYPQAAIIPKVRDNLQVLEQHLDQLDPLWRDQEQAAAKQAEQRGAAATPVAGP